MNLNMRFPLSKSCQMTSKLLRHVFYIMYHKNYYQAYFSTHPIAHGYWTTFGKKQIQIFDGFLPLTPLKGGVSEHFFPMKQNLWLSSFSVVFLSLVMNV